MLQQRSIQHNEMFVNVVRKRRTRILRPVEKIVTFVIKQTTNLQVNELERPELKVLDISLCHFSLFPDT